jgi:hypothetical protein
LIIYSLSSLYSSPSLSFLLIILLTYSFFPLLLSLPLSSLLSIRTLLILTLISLHKPSIPLILLITYNSHYSHYSHLSYSSSLIPLTPPFSYNPSHLTPLTSPFHPSHPNPLFSSLYFPYNTPLYLFFVPLLILTLLFSPHLFHFILTISLIVFTPLIPPTLLSSSLLSFNLHSSLSSLLYLLSLCPPQLIPLILLVFLIPLHS